MKFSLPTGTIVLALFLAPLTGSAAPVDLVPDQLSPETFNPAAILKTANKLIAIGNQDAYASLMAYAAKPRDPKSWQDRIYRDYYIAWLCLLIYDPKPGSFLRVPAFGGPQFPPIENYTRDKGMESRDWPRFPLVVVQNVPFLLVRGYILFGVAEPGSEFLKDYQAHGVFRTTAYPIPTRADAAAALTDLLASPAWKALDWHESTFTAHCHDNENREVEFLGQQVDRIK